MLWGPWYNSIVQDRIVWSSMVWLLLGSMRRTGGLLADYLKEEAGVAHHADILHDVSQELNGGPTSNEVSKHLIYLGPP